MKCKATLNEIKGLPAELQQLTQKKHEDRRSWSRCNPQQSLEVFADEQGSYQL